MNDMESATSNGKTVKKSSESCRNMHPNPGFKTSLPLIELNSTLNETEFKTKLSNAFQKDKCFSVENDCEEGGGGGGGGKLKAGPVLHNEPFLCCHVPKFLSNEDFLQNLKDELLNLEFFEKNNDLYKFHQTHDLKKVKTPYIASLRSFLYGTFREWLQEITGLKLNTTINMNCARYDYTDVLLCHDDQLEGRQIAFILYLVPPWKESDGGALDLIGCDDNDDPSHVVKSIYPVWNSFVFFKVLPKSHHQVGEILTEDKTRLSVSGWFYGEPVEYPLKTVRLQPELLSPVFIEEDMLYDWLNPEYLDPESQMEIRLKFEEDSELELVGFLNEDKYKEVAKALRGASIEWSKQGPLNKRNFEMANMSALPQIVKDCLEFLRSEAVFLILSNLTGLRLHELAEVEDTTDEESEGNSEPKSKKSKQDKHKSKSKDEHVDAKCFTEVRRWNHGSYTLLHDNDKELSDYALDVILFFNCEDWQNEYGGYVSYLAKDEDEELLTVYPQENALALVFRDKETLRFVKHINHRTKASERPSDFHTIWSVFYE